MDHHRFLPEDMERILQEACGDGVRAIVTTQKDAVRMPPLQDPPVPIFFLRVAIKITGGATDFADCVSRICYV
jgi:tetraacyldisaccharide 4'-kinase